MQRSRPGILSLSMKPNVVIAILLLLVVIGPALAEEHHQPVTLALIDKPWAMRLDVSGFRIQADGVKPDGRRYLLAIDEARSIHLSVTLETVQGAATEEGCIRHLEHAARTASPGGAQGPWRDHDRRLFLLEYRLPAAGKAQAEELHLLACTVNDDVYADIHLSQGRGQGGDASSLRALLHSLAFVAAPTPSSLDHFRAGSAPFLSGQFALAIPHYEQALVLEQANPVLDRTLWHLLIHNLGMAYGRIGNLAKAKATFDYGLSKDPANPMWHYELARIYAGMNDRDKLMQSLNAAFFYHRNRHGDEHMPDPRQDVSFGRFMLDPVFRRLTESLVQPAI
ncbi:MAG: tetratricopeptide repeat protein [Nitrospira sp.]|nr:tetratricopeptide repeat protein [Nitrospira sp.]